MPMTSLYTDYAWIIGILFSCKARIPESCPDVEYLHLLQEQLWRGCLMSINTDEHHANNLPQSQNLLLVTNGCATSHDYGSPWAITLNLGKSIFYRPKSPPSEKESG